ncbi:MAG TPA: hypothetical protein VNB06_10495 [Thermoanaerobaculia bacterium]|nr:hypothetical protein [Thermoanaerobaculia bacterium]
MLGETPSNSVITFGKWAIVRETINGGQGLRFTFGSNADYGSNPTRFKIGHDGELAGKGIARAFGVIDSDGTVLAGSEYIESVQVGGPGIYRIKLAEPTLNDCSKHPILLSVREPFFTRTAQYECTSTDFSVMILDSLGKNFAEQFSFVVF